MSVAKAMFAMTSPVVRLIASLTVSQVRAIALSNASQIRVRWDNDPEFWRDLLVACRAGEERALRGESGCGKTTFLNLVSGILAADSGVISIDGTDMASLREPAAPRRPMIN